MDKCIFTLIIQPASSVPEALCVRRSPRAACDTEVFWRGVRCLLRLRGVSETLLQVRPGTTEAPRRPQTRVVRQCLWIQEEMEQPELIYPSFALCGTWLGTRHAEAGIGMLLNRGPELWQRLGCGACRAGGGASPWGGGFGVFTCTAGASVAVTKSPSPPGLNPGLRSSVGPAPCTSCVAQP